MSLEEIKLYKDRVVSPETLPILLSIYQMWYERYQESKLIENLQDALLQHKDLLSFEKYQQLAEEIEIAKARIIWYSLKVLQEKIFLSLSDDKTWKEIQTPSHIFQAIRYFQEEFVKIQRLVSSQIKETICSHSKKKHFESSRKHLLKQNKTKS